MKRSTKILLAAGAVYVGLLVLAVVIFGFSREDSEFLPQNEFKLDTWVDLPGPLDINKGVLYLVLAAGLTIWTMTYVARRMETRPNRTQTLVETVYTFMRDDIVGSNMDRRMATKWFPFLGTIFLFIWYSNLIGFIPLPTNTQEKFNIFGANIPSFAIYAATANLSVPLVLALVVFIAYTAEGIRAKGLGGYLRSLIPQGVTGGMAVFIFILELLSNFMRLISLSVRLFANMLAGHLIILFMAGGMAILLGIEAIGVFALPLGWAIYIFEVGLVASLQAFIFAVLSAIYLGGAVAESH
jgi:F-type H+-transporting ATPase subunit a